MDGYSKLGAVGGERVVRTTREDGVNHKRGRIIVFLKVLPSASPVLHSLRCPPGPSTAAVASSGP